MSPDNMTIFLHTMDDKKAPVEASVASIHNPFAIAYLPIDASGSERRQFPSTHWRWLQSVRPGPRSRGTNVVCGASVEIVAFRRQPPFGHTPCCKKDQLLDRKRVGFDTTSLPNQHNYVRPAGP